MNPASLESIMKIFRFYKKAQDKEEPGNEGLLLAKIFKEYRGERISMLTEADLNLMKQEHDVPMEIQIK